ncbi:hypothetical protein AwWohl_13900 [Gammaproteobacteria bacterium]|nr:hypothetical protein AwWohl_13900 [Gammaproteobacteria bacterium]
MHSINFFKIIFLSLIFILSSCSTNANNANSENKSAHSIGAFTGKAVVTSILELDKGYTEIGVEISDGRTSSIKTSESSDFYIGQKVRVERKNNGTGTVTP